MDLGEEGKKGLGIFQLEVVVEEPEEGKNWVFHRLENLWEVLEVGGLG